MFRPHKIHNVTGLMGLGYKTHHTCSFMTPPKTILHPHWASNALADCFFSHVPSDSTFTQPQFYGLSFQLLTYNILHHSIGSWSVHHTSPGKTPTLVKLTHLSTLCLHLSSWLLLYKITQSYWLVLFQFLLPQISVVHSPLPSKPTLFL